jgi:amino acid transporter
MAAFARRLSLAEASGLSLSVIAPTITAAFNITLVVQAAGSAAPLTFAIGTLAIALVAVSFVAFTRRVAHAGSAYAYITHTFGSRAGFLAGWTLLLTYLGFASGFAGLVGSFGATVLRQAGFDVGRGWILIGVASMVLAWWFAYRDMRLAGRLMLALEAAAVLAIVALCILVLRAVQPTPAAMLATFEPQTAFGGWTGIAAGMVFTVLSFGGFEGAATLGEETVNPRRSIPVAMFATVILAGVFFMFVAFCEVLGYGQAGIGDLAHADAPLNDLAVRFASPRLATLLDLATATSAFSGVMGALAAAARVLFALGRAGLAPRLARIDARHGTPVPAIAVSAVLIIVPFVVAAPWCGGASYYSYASTVGTLALMLIYVGVGGAESVEAWREQRRGWALTCLLGPVILLWALFRTVYPVPDFPNNLWPYVVLAWIAAATALLRLRPAVAQAPLPDYL